MATTLLALIRALAVLPLTLQRSLGRTLGWLACALNVDAVRVTRINLARCFPELSEEARERLVRESLEQTAQLVTEAGLVFHWTREQWMPLARRVQGEQLIDEARQRGQGVLILVPHLGNWEYLGLYLGKYGLTALYDPPRLRALEDPIRRFRNRAGARLEPITTRGLRAVVRTLASGGVAVLLPDQVPERGAGLHVEFFGKPALTMNLVHRLIRRTNPVVLVAAALRTKGGFDLRFIEPDPAIHARDPVVSLAAMNQGLERLVRQAPAQYQWEYKRFKRQPLGGADWYAGDASNRAESTSDQNKVRST